MLWHLFSDKTQVCKEQVLSNPVAVSVARLESHIFCNTSIVYNVIAPSSLPVQMKTIRTLSISKSNPQLTIGANNRPLQPRCTAIRIPYPHNHAIVYMLTKDLHTRKNRRVWFYDAHPAAGHHAASTCQDDPFLIPFLAMVLLTFIIVSISMYIWLAEGKRPCAQPPWDPKSWDSHGESHSGGHGH